MLARTGNMSHVYREIAARIELEVNQVPRRTADIEAEISEGSSADWYLVNAFPGDDLRAMRWLARRRFGVFRPMQQRKEPHHEGQQIGVMEPVFPGWLFVFVWDMRKLQSRVRSCPGIMGIFCNPVTLAPLPVPDDFIQRLRARAWVVEELLTHTAQECERHEPQRKPRRPSKQERKALDRLKGQAKQQFTSWSQSAWDSINGLEPHERIALLTRALVPPVVG